jgi:heat shock protein 1/8
LTVVCFEDLCNDIFQKILQVVKHVIQDSKIEVAYIHRLFLCGSSTRIPRITKLVSNFLNVQQPLAGVDLDGVVACGAAIQAAILSGSADVRTKDIVLLDAIPLSLG